MNLCADGHNEVCYEERDCPCCALLRKNSNLEEELFDLKQAISELETGEKITQENSNV